ncbi:MAG: aminotransferase class V-fold PLP-dependent enzyme [Hyphomicrobiales bacterium]|nr:aminotransferase class V-fold PLP-dependent enzyme [Hyphomicrobiales bacterium]MBV8825046.1 aminotransferase class V-fold PLP-dependent enzyme [Hyphomicrobiales bacterium]MBV9429877.1 aminotransferase class V-fold PLP-dependent enzyme [Bradyrhizobiaceae bacterium]
MTVRGGREFLVIPGPTTVPDEVLQAMHRPAVDIYSGPLIALTDSLFADLAKIFRTAGRAYVYIANGHGAWEAALTNVLSRGDKVLVLESGRFARAWGDAAAKLGCEVETLAGDWRRAVRPAEVGARLRADEAGRIKAILAVQIDTASGVVNDIAAIGAAIKAARHDALFMVDAVASLGCMPFEMDAWGVDVAMSGSQKGLMTPPGLSFVAAGARARAVHETADLRTPYWDWTAREGDVHYQKYAGTPPEHLMFALRRALDMLLAEGLDNVFLRHRLLAEAVRRAVDVWSQGQAIGFNVIEPSERSDTVTTVLMGDGRDPRPLVDYCNKKCGVVLGIGIGDLSGKAFRIAHMGHVNAPMVLGTLGVIEVGLNALGIPHGSGGAQAAIDWLGEQVTA